MKTTILKTFIVITIASTIVSCNNNESLIKEIEKNKLELSKSDSILKEKEKILAAFAIEDTSKSELKDFVQILVMIKNNKTRENLNEIISVNSDLLEKVNNDKITSEEAKKLLEDVSQKHLALKLEIDEISKSAAELDSNFIKNLEAPIDPIKK